MTTDAEVLDQERIREQVRNGYAAVAVAGEDVRGREKRGCCGGGQCDDIARTVGYSEADLAALPDGANMGLSCGNPTALAGLREGEVLLDLGSGGGFDIFIAAPKVGPLGRAIGVDMTPEMIGKARRNAVAFRERTGLNNVEFRLGEIEHLPVADATVDVVISNCVINLSPDKPNDMADWRDPIYVEMRASLPEGLTLGDYVVSLALEARRPCCGN